MMAVIYARVSTEEQARHGYSLGEQIHECRKRAVELGATEIAECVDEIGGDILDRPGLTKARQLIRSGGVKWFICLDPDRFSRQLMNQLLVTEEIDNAGVTLVFLQHNYEKTPEGRLFYSLRGAISQFEKAKILERTSRGKRGKVKRGELPGHLDPYGYTHDTQADKLIINEEEAKWVKQMFAWATDPDPDERLGQYRIAERLNQIGVPAPRGDYWYRSTVASILHNQIYTGTLYWGKYDHSGYYQERKARTGKRSKPTPRPEAEWGAIPVPPLITTETLELVRHYIELDKRRRSKGRTYMLTGLAICGRCGGHIQTKPMRVRYLVCANRYPQYRDMSTQRRLETKPCDLPHVVAEPVEDFVWTTICEWIRSPSARQRAIEQSREGPSTISPLSEELAAVEQQRAEAEESQERLLMMVARANVRPDIAERQINRLTEQIEQLTRLQNHLRTKLGAATKQEQVATQFLAEMDVLEAELAHRLDVISDAHRTNIVRRLVSAVIISGKDPSEWTVLPLQAV